MIDRRILKVALAPEGYYSHDPIPVSGCYRSYDEQVIARDYFCGKGPARRPEPRGLALGGLSS